MSGLSITQRFDLSRVQKGKGLIGAGRKLRRAAVIRMGQAVKLNRAGDIYQKKVEQYQQLVNQVIEVAQGLLGEIRALQAQIRTEQKIIQIKMRERMQAISMIGRLRQQVTIGMRKKLGLEKLEQMLRAKSAQLSNMAANAESNAMQRLGQVSVNTQRRIARR